MLLLGAWLARAEHALNVVSVVESVLEPPRQVLQAQQYAARGEAVEWPLRPPADAAAPGFTTVPCVRNGASGTIERSIRTFPAMIRDTSIRSSMMCACTFTLDSIIDSVARGERVSAD